ncbi:MAG: hypothetical protein IPK03_08445 [Bacteroidetes bacterium]|nr:hypothetical protein [Bacteroidota bacterium]
MNVFNLSTMLTKVGLTNDHVFTLSKNCNFIKRNRKLNPINLLFLLIFSSAGESFSFSKLSLKAIYLLNISITKQSFHTAIVCKPCLEFMKEIFSSVCGKFCALNSGTPFRRVLIQDSTIVKAPKSLFSIYSGVANGTSKSLQL